VRTATSFGSSDAVEPPSAVGVVVGVALDDRALMDLGKGGAERPLQHLDGLEAVGVAVGNG
jgi:hypothetical protein